MPSSPIRLFVAGDPVPQGSKVGFPFVKRLRRCSCRKNPKCKSCYGTGTSLLIKVAMHESSKRLKGWRETVSTGALEHRLRRFDERTPLHVVAVFAFRRPKSHFNKSGLSKAGREFPGPQGKTSHGDVEKLMRAVNDALASVLFHDDADIVSEHGVKVWTTGDEGVYLSVAPWTVGYSEDGPRCPESPNTLLHAFGVGFASTGESITIRQYEGMHAQSAIQDSAVAVGDWSRWTEDPQQSLLPAAAPEPKDDVPFGKALT